MREPADSRSERRAVQAAERAVALDPASVDAHIALGKVRYWGDWDWPAAGREFQAARELDPLDSYANYFLGELAYTFGRAQEALEFYQRALDRDPLNFSAMSSVSSLYGYPGRPADELAGLRRLAELNPGMPGIHSTIAITELRTGNNLHAALATIEREPDAESRLWYLAFAYALGRAAEADAAIRRYADAYGSREPYSVAALYAMRGTADAAFEWLDRAYRQKDSGLVEIKLSRQFATIRTDPRYRALLKKMRLPE